MSVFRKKKTPGGEVSPTGSAPASTRAPREMADDTARHTDVSRAGVYGFASAVFVLVGGAIAAGLFAALGTWAIVLGAVAGFLAAASFRVAPQWERVPVLRLGKFHHIAGPGLYAVIPFVDSAAAHVDIRTITSAFNAEQALTADLVSVDIDAILFWVVWDPRKACFEVANYPQAVLRSAQIAIRDAVGQVNLEDLSMRRRQLDHELQAIMSEKCEGWGISILSVEIRDIRVPKALEDSLSREAQASRERDARVLLADVEKDIAAMYYDAAELYEKRPQAMKLRAMNIAYESAKEGKGVIFAPNDIADAFGVKDVAK